MAVLELGQLTLNDEELAGIKAHRFLGIVERGGSFFLVLGTTEEDIMDTGERIRIFKAKGRGKPKPKVLYAICEKRGGRWHPMDAREYDVHEAEIVLRQALADDRYAGRNLVYPIGKRPVSRVSRV